MAVNRVTSTPLNRWVGRVLVGQVECGAWERSRSDDAEGPCRRIRVSRRLAALRSERMGSGHRLYKGRDARVPALSRRHRVPRDRDWYHEAESVDPESDGERTHDALFRTIDEQAQVQRLGRCRELNFVDAYRYKIAAYRLADLIGLGHMIGHMTPVTVERVWDGQKGSLSWWIEDVMFDEATRRKESQWPEDMARWTAQKSTMMVFAELVYDTDRNQTNQFYTTDWDL